MKKVKTFFKILFIFIFVISALLNVLLAGSSYGTLLFKYDQNKFSSMVEHANTQINYNYFTTKNNYGIQITQTNLDSEKNDSLSLNLNFDKKSNPTFEATYKYEENDQKITNHYYFKDNTLYKNINGEKSKETIAFSKNLLNDYFDISIIESICALNSSVLEEKENKTGISFSFKPFYLIGIKYSYEATEYKYTYEYDLNGYLRKTTVEPNGKDTITIKFDYKNKKIDFPTDLENY